MNIHENITGMIDQIKNEFFPGPCKTLLALTVTALFLPQAMATIIHTDADSALLNGSNVIKLDATDSESRLNSESNLIPANTENNVVYIIATPDGTRSIYGGFCMQTPVCTVKNNVIIMNDGDVRNRLSAGSAGAVMDNRTNGNGSASSNASSSGSVSLYGGTVAFAIGSDSSAVALTSGNYNAYATSAASGIVNMYGGTATSGLYGASTEANAYVSDNTAVASLSASASASGTVNIYSGITEGSNVVGASAIARTNSLIADPDTVSSANATGTVSIYNSATINSTIAGAVAYVEDRSPSTTNMNNTVTANGNVNLYGGTVSESVYGAYVALVINSPNSQGTITAHGNVTIAGDTRLQKDDGNGDISYSSELWGTYLYSTSPARYYDIFSGNTLTMSAAPLTVTNLGNFQYYNFVLNDNNSGVVNQTNAALITVTNSLVNSDTATQSDTGTPITTTNKSRVKLTGISGQRAVNEGDKINLITLKTGAVVSQGSSTTSLPDFFDLTDSSNTINVGLVRTAQVSYSTTADSVVATVGKTTEIDTGTEDNNSGTVVSPQRVQTNVKPLAEARLAGLQNVTRSADSLAQVLNAPSAESGTFSPIAVLDGGKNRYNSGSYIDSRDYRFIVGTRYQASDTLSGGLVVEYSRSNFDTYNNLSSVDIHGEGESYHYGAALFGRYSLPLGGDRFYTDASLRVGRTSTRYASADLVTGGGMGAQYNSKVNYLGGSAGTGYLYTLNEFYALDSSARYFYARFGSDSVVIDGDQVNFDAASSSRVQLKEQLVFRASTQLTATFSGIMEYETQGNARADAYGVSIDGPSVKGATGIAELGFQTKPLENHPALDVDLTFRAYNGQREGVSASIMVKYSF